MNTSEPLWIYTLLRHGIFKGHKAHNIPIRKSNGRTHETYVTVSLFQFLSKFDQDDTRYFEADTTVTYLPSIH